MHVPATFFRRLTYFALAASSYTLPALAQPYAYVANLSGNNISVVNTSNYTVVSSIPVCIGPTGLAVTPDGASVYVACQSANAVAVINAATNAVVTTINLGASPTQIAISPSGAQVYAVIPTANQVMVIDTASRAAIATISVGSRPNSVAFSPNTARAYVTNLWSSNVSVIDTDSRSVVSTFAASSGPSGLVVTPDGRTIYVANEYANTVTVHDAASGNITSTITGFTFPDSVAITPNGGRVFVINGNAGTVSVIDTATKAVIATPAVASLPASVAVSTDGTRAFVANEYGFSLSVIDTTTNAVINTVSRVGVYPVGVATVPAPVGPAVQACTYSISPGSAAYGQGGGPGTIAVSAQSGCPWTAASNAGWIAISSGASGSGGGVVTYNVSPNANAAPISGSLTIAGQTFTVSETGVSCSYTFSSTGTSIAAIGGAGTVNITAPSGCAWTLTSDASWITLTSGISGSGSAAVSFTIAANTAMTMRAGHLSIGGQVFGIGQAGTGFVAIRVNCGGPAMTDSSGNVWAADNSRNTSTTAAPIANTTMPALYQKESWSNGTLQYQFSVPNGAFTLKLRFAEIYLTQRGQRMFNIVVNGNTIYSYVDILGQAQANTAFDVTVPVYVSNGQVTVQIVPVVGPAKLSALEIY
jgi:YVTN family beta-propeller protein